MIYSKGYRVGCAARSRVRFARFGPFPRPGPPREVDRRRGALGRVLFRQSLPEQGLQVSPHPALQWSFRVWPGSPTGVDVLVAAAAGDEGLAPPHGHEVHPGGFLASARLAEIGELADVVDFQVHRVLAYLTASGQEPVDQLVAAGAGHD